MELLTKSRIIFTILLVLQILAVISFGQGYFIIRSEIPQHSIPTSEVKGQKVILAVIDSLRFDMAVNNFTFIQKMMQNYPNNTLLLKSIADPPTVTTQRVQALMSGNFPPYIKIGSNFFANEITEDNLLNQLQYSNKTAAFFGDDTWVQLFPTSFKTTFPTDSFSTSDFDKTDNAIQKHLLPTLKSENHSLYVAHFLGIDHIAHMYNSKNKRIRQKFQEYSKYFKKVYNQMDNDTILIITSDHGMSESGNHGGVTEEEVSTFIFAIKKQGNFNNNNNNNNKQLLNQYRTVSQIDLVPTLAQLLGISIPFSNLGLIISEFFQEQHLNQLYYTNLYQVWKYLNIEQSKQEKYQPELFSKWRETVQQQDPLSDNELQSLILSMQNESRQILNQFNVNKMLVSLIIMILIFLVTIFMISKQVGQSKEQIITQQNQVRITNIITLSFKDNKFAYVIIIIYLFYEIICIYEALLKLRLEYDYLLGSIVRPLIIFQMYSCYIKYQLKQSICNQSNIYQWTIFIFCLFMAQQYNTSPLRQYRRSIFKLISLSTLVNSMWLTHILPCLFLHLYFMRYPFQVSKFRILLIFQQQSICLRIHFHILLLLSQLANYLIFNSDHQIIVLPLICYLLTILGFIFYQNIIFVIPIILLVNGIYSFVVFLLFGISVSSLMSIIYQQNNVKTSYIQLCSKKDWIFMIILVQLSWFYWLCLGNRATITSIKFENGFIGLTGQHVFISGILLLLYLGGPYIIPLLFVPQYEQQINGQCNQQFRLKLKLLYSMTFYLRCLLTAIHCFNNIHSLLLLSDYAPRFIFDACSLIIVNIFNIMY